MTSRKLLNTSHCTAYVKSHVKYDDVSPWFIMVLPMYYLVIIPFSICFIMYHCALLQPDFLFKFCGISVDCFNVRPPLSNFSSANCWWKWNTWSTPFHYIKSMVNYPSNSIQLLLLVRSIGITVRHTFNLLVDFILLLGKLPSLKSYMIKKKNK